MNPVEFGMWVVAVFLLAAIFLALGGCMMVRVDNRDCDVKVEFGVMVLEHCAKNQPRAFAPPSNAARAD